MTNDTFCDYVLFLPALALTSVRTIFKESEDQEKNAAITQVLATRYDFINSLRERPLCIRDPACPAFLRKPICRPVPNQYPGRQTFFRPRVPFAPAIAHIQSRGDIPLTMKPSLTPTASESKRRLANHAGGVIFCGLSQISVTGPSLQRWTAISAWKMPAAVCSPVERARSKKYS